MSESKFTPGPWEIIGQFEDKVYHEASDTVVAQAWYPGASSKSPSPADTMKANARLIAAAPDMYKALEEIDFLFACDDEGLEQPAHEQWREAANKISAAIAKADGTK